MRDDELLEMYEREWKSLMDKVNEVEENIVQTRLRIEKRNAAQQSVQADGAICPECGGINFGHYVTCSRAFSPLPRR